MSYSEIVVVLDRSGSMESAKDDHVGGLNSFIKDQQKLDGEVKFTLVQFDSINPFELVYNREDIQNVGECNLIPRGGTPLIESVTRTIAAMTDELKKETRKPDQVVFMIITDGQENQSGREFSKSNLKSLIEEKQKLEWQFLFLGANIDAFGEAASIGVRGLQAANFNNFDANAIQAAYGLLNSKMSTSRHMYGSGLSCAEVAAANCYSFTDDDRKKMNNETLSGNSSIKSN